MPPAKQRPIYIDGYRVDLSIKEEHTFSSETTEHAVESGGDISDHIRDLPDEITMDCVVSDTPVGDIATVRDASNVVLDGDAADDVVLPSEEAYAHLQRIRAEKRLVTVETSLGTFKDMALVLLTVPREAATTGGLFFSCTFKHIRIEENRRFASVASAPGGQKKKDLGGKTPPEMVIKYEIIWRKGDPPGAQLVSGYRTERVYRAADHASYISKSGKKRFLSEELNSDRYVHEDKKTPLTTDELQALYKDLMRDARTRAQVQEANRDREAGKQYLKQLQQNPNATNNRNPQMPDKDAAARQQSAERRMERSRR